MSYQQEISRELLELLKSRNYHDVHEEQAFPSALRLFKRMLSFVRHHIKLNKRRKLLEAIHRLSAHSIVKCVDDFRGTFELISESNLTLMILENSYEVDLIPFIEKILKHGDHVIDIGANVGLFTNLSAKLVGPAGKVLSIEPNPFVYTVLESNIRRNQLDNIILFNGVATSAPSFYKLNATEGCPEYSSLGAIVHPHAPKEIKEITVKGETVDNLVSANNLNPILLKIDVEGAEGLVLSGAAMVLEKYKPYVLSELDDRLLKELSWDAMQVINLLEEYDYKIFDADNGSALTSRQLDRAFSGEIIALPKESTALS